MDLESIRSDGSIVLECISGSKSYGLDTPTSDTDIKGVFVLPKDQFYGLDYCPQVSDDTNDVVFYELGRYIELLLANNPGMLELAATADRHVIYRHGVMGQIRAADFVSRQCAKTFGGYANSQLKRARGLNKKIVNPVEGPRRPLLDFCFVNQDSGSVRLTDFLAERNWNQQDCGLTRIAHMANIYGLYHPEAEPESSARYRGVISGEGATDVILSSVAKGIEPVAMLYFNKDAYSKHCRDHKDYNCLLYTSPSPRDATLSRMPSSA